MKLWMSGEIDADVADAYREVRKVIENSVNQLLGSHEFESPFREWAVIAIIRRKDSPDYGEIVKKDTRKRALEFRLKVDHKAFVEGELDVKRALVIDMLLRSVDLMKSLRVPDSDTSMLREVLVDIKKVRSLH